MTGKMDNGPVMSDAAEAPVSDEKPPRRTAWRFCVDVAVLLTLVAALAVLTLWLVAVWMNGDVSDVRGVGLRVVAAVFFFRVFQFYIAAMLGVMALAALLLRFRKVALLHLLLALTLGAPAIRAYLPKSPPPVIGPALKIYSANLYSTNRDAAAILRSIRAEDPDVIVLLEVTPWSYALLMREFGTSHPHQHRPHYNGGGMILSRVPFREEPPVVRLPGNHSRTPVVFELDGRELAVYPVHLVSPGSLSLVRQNREQIREFLQIDEQERRPMVIVGDCNFTPQTPNFRALRRAGFRSSYEHAGFGLCNTWGPRWWPRLYALPGVQIDQMLLQQPLTARWHRVGLDTGSDHRPIVAEIGFSTP